MAVIPAVYVVNEAAQLVVEWPNMANGDTGEPIENLVQGDRCAQAKGTFGSGGTVTMQGSCDVEVPASAAQFDALKDPNGNALALVTANRLEAVSEATPLVRPAVTAGDGTTSITVRMFFRGRI